MKKYSRLLSAAVMIGALKVKVSSGGEGFTNKESKLFYHKSISHAKMAPKRLSTIQNDCQPRI